MLNGPSPSEAPLPPAPAAPLVPAAPYVVDALPGGTRLKEFELRRVIGVGGFSIVYLAFDTMLQREVAIKEYLPGIWVARGAGTPQVRVPRPDDREPFARGLRSFLDEARLLAGFRHESLVEVHRFWEANGTAYMAMRYHEGRTLRQLRAGLSGDPDAHWLRTLIEPVLGALELLHASGVYHRDIAPDNILVPAGGAAVLLDFGAARRVVDDRTQAFTAILKPNYAPIEQYGDSPALRQGPWTDLYALGAVLRFMMTALEPTPAVMRVVADAQAPLADEAGVAARSPFEQAMRRAVDWALAVDPQHRPRSVAAWRAVLDGAPVPAWQRPLDEPVRLRAPGRADTFELVASAAPGPAGADAFVSTLTEAWDDAGPANSAGAVTHASAKDASGAGPRGAGRNGADAGHADPRKRARGDAGGRLPSGRHDAAEHRSAGPGRRWRFGAAVGAAALAGIGLAVAVMLAVRPSPVAAPVGGSDGVQPAVSMSTPAEGVTSGSAGPLLRDAGAALPVGGAANVRGVSTMAMPATAGTGAPADRAAPPADRGGPSAGVDRQALRHAPPASRPLRADSAASADAALRSTACMQSNSVLRAICIARMCTSPALRTHPQCVERQAAEDARQRAQMNR